GHGAGRPLVLSLLADAAVEFPVMLLLAAGAAAARRGRSGRRPQEPVAAAPPPLADVSFTRGELVKLGVVGGATLFLPFRPISGAWAGGFPSSPPATPFRQRLVVPPRAVTSIPSVPTACLPGKVAGVDFDFYEVHARVGVAQIYPGSEGGPTKIWGYTQTADALTPGPTFLAASGRPIDVRFVNDLGGEQEPSGAPVRLTTHTNGGHQTPSHD